MLIESEYLKKQIKEMAEVTERNAPGGDCALHHAYNMVRATLEAMLKTIDAIERHTVQKRNPDDKLLEDCNFEL